MAFKNRSKLIPFLLTLAMLLMMFPGMAQAGIGTDEASLSSVLGQPIYYDGGNGAIASPYTASVNVASDILTVAATDVVAFFSDGTFYGTDNTFKTPDTSNVELMAGAATYVYIKVTSIDGTNIVFYKIKINRATPQNDATISTVLNEKLYYPEQRITGSLADPVKARINVENNSSTLSSIDIVASVPGATVTFYGTDSTFAKPNTGVVNLVEGSYSNIYIKVVAQDGMTILYYEVEIYRSDIRHMGDYNYTVTAGEANVIGYKGAGGDITVPSTLAGYPVTNIGNLHDCTDLTSIRIQEGVKVINYGAFKGCTGLTSITIPESVTSIGQLVFQNCSSLTSITVADYNLNYASIDGVLYNKAETILIMCPSGLTNISIPESVTEIGEFAFIDCKGLTSIAIPQGVNSIGRYAFAGCTGLTGITIPQNVNSIDKFAFSDCKALIFITFKSATTIIKNSIMYGEFTIPSQTKIIGYDPSTAKDYAARYGNKFELIGSTQPVNTDLTGMTEMTTASPTTVGSTKEWTIKLSGLVKEPISSDKIYVTNSQGIKQATTCTVINSNGLSQIKVTPTSGYAAGDYLLFVRDIESAGGMKIKNQVYLNFTVQ